jgi:hypothetical protein
MEKESLRAAAGRLVRTIRRHIPAWKQFELEPRENEILRPFDNISEVTFAWFGAELKAPHPRSLLDDQPSFREVAEAYRDVEALVEGHSDPFLNAIFREFKETPVFVMRMETTKDGTEEPWITGYFPIDNTLLDELAAAAQNDAACEPARDEQEKKRIPVNHRTVPMTLTEAAALMGYARSRSREKARKMLREAIGNGAVKCEKLDRQQFVFDRRDFPKEVQQKLGPTRPKSAR